jgi:hypothetical protein
VLRAATSDKLSVSGGYKGFGEGVQKGSGGGLSPIIRDRAPINFPSDFKTR